MKAKKTTSGFVFLLETSTRRINAVAVAVKAFYCRSVAFAKAALKNHCWPWLVLATAIWYLEEVRRYNLRLIDGEILPLCGILLLLIGSHLSLWIPDKLSGMLQRLRERGVLDGAPDQFKRMFADLDRSQSHWTVKLLVAVGTFALLLAYYIANGSDVTGNAGLFTLGSVAAGFVAFSLLKSAFGPTLIHGSLIGLLNKHGIRLRLYPEHPDGAGGFGLIRSYYSYQALVIAIPAIHLGGWWFILAYGGSNTSVLSQRLSYLASYYQPWRLGYLMLFFVVVGIEVLAFAIPIWKFHLAIQTAMKGFDHETDKLSLEARELKQALLSNPPQRPEQFDRAKDRLELINTRLAAFQKLKLWPIDVKIAWGTIGGTGVMVLSLLLHDAARLSDLGTFASDLIRHLWSCVHL